MRHRGGDQRPVRAPVAVDPRQRLVDPRTLVDQRDPQQYVIAGLLLAVGVVLWLITFFINRAMWGRQTYVKNPEALEGSETKPQSVRD